MMTPPNGSAEDNGRNESVSSDARQKGCPVGAPRRSKSRIMRMIVSLPVIHSIARMVAAVSGGSKELE